MADYVVEKHQGGLRPWIYRDSMESDYVGRGYVPGEDFIKVSDVGTEGAAIEQAEAYFNGTHEEPGKIDAWVEEWTERQ